MVGPWPLDTIPTGAAPRGPRARLARGPIAIHGGNIVFANGQPSLWTPLNSKRILRGGRPRHTHTHAIYAVRRLSV
eukprot:scaffold69596_cov56-Phaeocystis_antarctica.AAC.1